MSTVTYPVRVDATLDPAMSRWLWLVKWLLAIPHFFVLLFLWIAFVAVSVVAFVAILFTGRYPPGMFRFNVGVLRWSWRVSYYTYGALGTDRYPPFTLAEVADYPAHLDVEQPEHLSRGLVLVKSWLLAIPHYLVVGIFAGGGTWALWQVGGDTRGAPGLIGLLVLFAAVALLFTGRYPEQVFDFVLGMNRWGLRVAAYSALMTDAYPPFRLDQGAHEPSGEPVPATPPPTAPPPSGPRRGWTAGRVVSLVLGILIGLGSLGLLAAGGVASWAASTQRDSAGYLTTDTRTFVTTSYAVTSDDIDLSTGGSIAPDDILGTVRIRVTPTDPSRPVFVGVGREAAVDDYLAGVGRAVVTSWAAGTTRTHRVGSSAPPSAPADARIWTAQVSGLGTQTLTWRPPSGHWVVVVMNPDGTAGMSVAADVGAEVPDLGWIAAGLLVLGGLLLIGAVLLVVVPVARASR